MLNHVLLTLHNIEEQLKVKSALLDSLMPGNSLEILPRGMPDYLHLPMRTLDELDQAEQDLSGKDEDKQRLVTELADIGGHGLEDMIKRTMRTLFTNELAMQITVCGKTGKKRFLGLGICQAVFDAVKLNLPTRDATKRDIEQCLIKWFRGAPDREGGRQRRRMESRRLGLITTKKSPMSAQVGRPSEESDQENSLPTSPDN